MDKYYLTTDNCASSYMIPVLVRRADGVAFGPSDIIETGQIVCGEDWGLTAREWVMVNVLPYTYPDHALGLKFIGENAGE